MATVPQMRTWADDEIVTPQIMNEQVRDMGNFVARRPGAVVRVADPWTGVGNGTHRPTFDTVEYDSDGLVDFATLANGLTIVTSGLYLVSLTYDIEADSSDVTVGRAFANLLGSNDECCRAQQYFDWAAGSGFIGTAATAKYLNAGDQVAYQMFFAASDTINWTFGGTTRTALSVLWIGT